MKDSEPFLGHDDALMRRRVLNTCVMIPKKVSFVSVTMQRMLFKRELPMKVVLRVWHHCVRGRDVLVGGKF